MTTTRRTPIAGASGSEGLPIGGAGRGKVKLGLEFVDELTWGVGEAAADGIVIASSRRNANIL